MKQQYEHSSLTIFTDWHNANTTLLKDCDCDCSDCDCACSSPILQHNALPVVQSITKWIRTQPSYTQRVDADHFICYSPYYHPTLISNSALKILTKFPEQVGMEALRLKMFEKIISEQFFEALMQTGLIHPEHEQLQILPSKGTTLTAWLQITDQCNLRCNYCYIDKAKNKMSLEIGKKCLDSLFKSARTHGYNSIKVKYAGGEPMTRFTLVKALHKYALSLSDFHKIQFEAVILSNGTLINKQKAEEMKSLGLSLMISLDGTQITHDYQRPSKSGNSSYQQILQGIKFAQEAGLQPQISITITNQNAHTLAEITRWLLENSLPFSYNLYRKLQPGSVETGFTVSDEVIIHEMTRAFRVIEENLPKHSLLGCLGDRANLAAPHLFTCGVGKNYLVFDSFGNIAKCHMKMREIITTYENHDFLTLVQTDQKGINNKSVEEKPECSLCEWAYWCTGGCPIIANNATGSYGSRSPYCKIYKKILPKIIRLEGLRLLEKYRNQNWL